MVPPPHLNQKLCRLLAKDLICETLDCFAPDANPDVEIHVNELVSGTLEACDALSDLGAFSLDKNGSFKPVFPHKELVAWTNERTFTQVEQGKLMRATCHLWSWFLVTNYKWSDSLSKMKADLRDALKDAGFVQTQDGQTRWSTPALPWLIDASLADLDVIKAAPAKQGAAIINKMPEIDAQRYASLVTGDRLRVFCLICTNWDGSNWQSRDHNAFQPSPDWRLGEAKSALNILGHTGQMS